MPRDPGSGPALEAALDGAAALLRQADALVVTAGAGMGIDSGLPDFRGPQGFWRAYPALRRRGLSFTEVASPDTFRRDPALAWGFYGHRLALYRRTLPHPGFALLRRWAEGLPHGGWVFTSNVDGQFQRAGWPADRIVECHGAIDRLQCCTPCHTQCWSAEAFLPEVDEAEGLLRSPLPLCRRCGGLARPNILMFGDAGWIESTTAAQAQAFSRWWAQEVRQASVVVIEIGAGTAVPSVRRFGEQLVSGHGARLVRINPDEPGVQHPRDVALPMPALAALQALEARVEGGRG